MDSGTSRRNLLPQVVVHRNLTHGVGELQVTRFLGQSNPLVHPTANVLKDLATRRKNVDFGPPRPCFRAVQVVPSTQKACKSLKMLQKYSKCLRTSSANGPW